MYEKWKTAHCTTRTGRVAYPRTSGYTPQQQLSIPRPERSNTQDTQRNDNEKANEDEAGVVQNETQRQVKASARKGPKQKKTTNRMGVRAKL